MQNEQQIADFIIEQVNSSRNISGARLGYALTQFAPDYRLRFGTLRSIVERLCAKSVGVIPPNGPGDVYYVPVSMLSSTIAETKPSETPADFWKAFTTPSSPSTLCLNKESGDFRLRLRSDPESSTPWVDVPPTTNDDHRKIASEFLAEIAPEHRSSFEEILKVPGFWSPWVARLRTFEQAKYSKAWAAFRFNKLCELYLQTLKSAGIAEDFAAESLRRLKAFKTAAYKQTKTTATGSPAAPSSSSSGLSLRRLATAALEAMSEDELRRVWLPLGPVADAIGKCHTR